MRLLLVACGVSLRRPRPRPRRRRFFCVEQRHIERSPRARACVCERSAQLCVQRMDVCVCSSSWNQFIHSRVTVRSQRIEKLRSWIAFSLSRYVCLCVSDNFPFKMNASAHLVRVKQLLGMDVAFHSYATRSVFVRLIFSLYLLLRRRSYAISCVSRMGWHLSNERTSFYLTSLASQANGLWLNSKWKMLFSDFSSFINQMAWTAVAFAGSSIETRYRDKLAGFGIANVR